MDANELGDLLLDVLPPDGIAMVALPGQLFLNTPIPVCLWFLANDKTRRGRDRRGETLFILDAAIAANLDRLGFGRP